MRIGLPTLIPAEGSGRSLDQVVKVRILAPQPHSERRRGGVLLPQEGKRRGRRRRMSSCREHLGGPRPQQWSIPASEAVKQLGPDLSAWNGPGDDARAACLRQSDPRMAARLPASSHRDRTRQGRGSDQRSRPHRAERAPLYSLKRRRGPIGSQRLGEARGGPYWAALPC
jgi:hypothetical protein